MQNHGPRCIKSSSLCIILHITLSLFQKLLPLHLLTFRTAFTDVLVRTMCWWPVKTVSRSVTLDCWTWWRTNRVSMPPERKMGKVAKLTYLNFQTGPLGFLLLDIRKIWHLHSVRKPIPFLSCLILLTFEFVYVPVRFSYCWFSPLSLQSHSFVKKSDVWAFGVTVWEMFVMKKPFHCNLEDRVLTKEEVNIFSS